MSSGTNYPWKRYWVPQGESPAMADGYFVEPTADELRAFFGVQSNGVPLGALKDVPCLVLLGDVGMGKTTVTGAEAAALATQLGGQKHEVLRRDLKRLTEQQIYRQVFDDPKVGGWIRGEHALTLFLDSLDECWRRIDELKSILVGEFERHLREKKPPLYLRLTCRSAEWRGEAGRSLERLFPKVGEKDQLQIYTLAPLSQNNVKQAATTRGRDGEDLLRRIADKDAQALASHPITFEMLFQIYVEGGDLTASRVELYERGCLHLCAEPHSEFGSQQQRRTTPQQRLAVASRLAALSVLTNRYLINGDSERPLGRTDVLETAQALGYFNESVGGEAIEVNRTSTAETLQTALFSERVEGVQTWRHQSYAEFLAAKYLSQCRVPAGHVITLLTDTTDNSHRLIPQLEETACWLADMAPVFFDALAPSNAEIFIRCDPGSLDAGRRALVVESYLDLVRRHEAPEVDWQLKHRFARLSHPKLAGQLGQIVVNRKENTLVREAAIEIAGFCHCRGLGPELIDVFLDRNDVFRLRTRAGFALEQMRNDEIRTALKRKATAASLDDHSDETKGFYLKILWPSHLTIEELLTLLTPPKKRNLHGSYRGFFEYELPKSLPESALPAVLDWLRDKKVNFDVLSAFGGFPTKITGRAYDRLKDPKVRNAFRQLLKSQGDRLHNFFRDAITNLTPQGEARRDFWVTVVEGDIDPQKLIIHGHLHQAGLLVAGDLSFFISCYRQSASEKHRESWRALVFRVFDAQDPLALELVSDLANSDQLVADELAARTSCRLVPDQQNWLKQDFQRQKKAEAERVANPLRPFHERLEPAMAAFEGGTTRAFWFVAEALHWDPDELGEHMVFTRIRVTEGKAWKALPADFRSRILTAIPRYLHSQEIEFDVWDDKTSYRAFSAALPSIVLLYDDARETLRSLPAELWRKWVPVIVSYFRYHNGDHDEGYEFALTLAFQAARRESLEAFDRFIALNINDDSKRSFIWRLGAVWCEDVRILVLRAIREQPLKATAAQDLLQLLHAHEPAAARELLEAILDERLNTEVCSILVPVAGAVLFCAYSADWGPRLVAIMEEDAPLGQAIMWRVLRGAGQPKGWLSKLPPNTTAALSHWMEAQFPGDPYEEDINADELRASAVTPHHDMFHFRRGVLESLIQRGTRAACAAMVDLMRKRPQDFWLGDVLAGMRKAARRTMWTRPDPETLMRTFSDSERRLIRTAGDLHSLLIESVKRFEATLHGSLPSL